MGQVSQHTRRELMRAAPLGWLSVAFASLAIAKQREFLEPTRVPYRGSDDALLDEMERAALDFFWNEAGATTVQVTGKRSRLALPSRLYPRPEMRRFKG
jgi:hypothetical protein